MNKKFFAPLEIKSGPAGQVTAVFATLSVIDLDGDVTLPGAFGNQAVLLEPWNHGHTLPVGKGRIREEGDTAVLNGSFFMDTTQGRDHFQTVKALGGMTQWSYTFSIKKSRPGQFMGKQVRFLEKLDVAGVGPVTRGAGIATRTISVKAAARRDLWQELAALEIDVLLQSPTYMQDRLLELGGPAYALKESARLGATRATNYVQALVDGGFSEPLALAHLDAYTWSLEQQVRQQNPAFYDANPGMVWPQVAAYLNQPA